MTDTISLKTIANSVHANAKAVAIQQHNDQVINCHNALKVFYDQNRGELFEHAKKGYYSHKFNGFPKHCTVDTFSSVSKIWNYGDTKVQGYLHPYTNAETIYFDWSNK